MVERIDISGTTWITIASSVRDTKFTVHGLTEGQEYNFRIHAANDNGIGPGLEGVNPIKVGGFLYLILLITVLVLFLDTGLGSLYIYVR